MIRHNFLNEIISKDASAEPISIDISDSFQKEEPKQEKTERTVNEFQLRKEISQKKMQIEQNTIEVEELL